MSQANVGPPRSVLLVDDEESILALLTAALKRAGTEDVVQTGSGEDALKILAERTFDVLVTDKSLPGIDGHEVIDQARHLHPHIGVVMITAKGNLESSTRGFRQRIDYYLLKPFDDIADFVDVVHASYRMHAHIRRLEEARAELDALLGKNKR
ncbi:MAG: response regulator [Deltaproteobacteria bacterium]|nr:response regulator [Deltaproteobacteria bacterium]